MWTSLKEYVPAVLRGFLYLILVGVVGGVVGLVLDALPDMEMPLWGWAAVCVLALAAAQFRAFHEVRQQRDASRPDRLRPDWEAHRVYDRIKHHSMWGYQPINPYEGPPIDAIRELHPVCYARPKRLGRSVRCTGFKRQNSHADFRNAARKYLV